MLSLAVILILLAHATSADDYKVVSLDEGEVKGIKYWDGDYYEFYGVPYASVPRGKDRFQGPLPPEHWEGVYEATVNNVICTQMYFGDDDEEFAYGQEDCLTLNLYVPTIATQDNPVPVVVYIHSGGYAIGHGNMAKYNYIVRHDVLVISVNYRLGALGFLCLGTKDIPGNAGMKDQVAALRWVNKNIRKFGGDPDKVTVAGFSVGAGMAELLTMSQSTEGLIDKIILDSGSAVSSWAVNRDPIATAINIAQSLGYNGTGAITELSDFYMDISADLVSIKSLHFYLRNGTFGFAPCIENVHDGIEPFLTESPLKFLARGANHKVSVLTGFANMEGISRLEQLESWRQSMEENFFEFLQTDLKFSDEKTKQGVAKEIKNFYFGGKVVSDETLEEYVDYFSDAMFAYSILKSAKLHAESGRRPVYLYEFSYVGRLSTKHRYMDKLIGASHRDQTSYILDFYSFTYDHADLDTRDRLTMMWADFIKYGNPTAYESVLVNYKWPNHTTTDEAYLSIDREVAIKRGLLSERYKFWEQLYEKYYFHPAAPKLYKQPVDIKRKEL